MEIKQPSRDELIVLEKPFLSWLIPLSIAGAGLMLILGSMKQYGIQAWYRTTYMLGGALAFWGVLYLLIGPKGSSVKLNREESTMIVEHKKGVRVLVKRYIFMQEVEQIRIEQKQNPKRPSQKLQYRLAANVAGEWVALTHWSNSQLYDFEQAAKQIQAFVTEAKQRLS
ncbi:MAG: hypothetical protein AAFS00_03920 [Bacteroidota bacterium]